MDSNPGATAAGRDIEQSESAAGRSLAADGVDRHDASYAARAAPGSLELHHRPHSRWNGILQFARPVPAAAVRPDGNHRAGAPHRLREFQESAWRLPPAGFWWRSRREDIA